MKMTTSLKKRLLAVALAVVLAVPVAAVSMPAESVQAGVKENAVKCASQELAQEIHDRLSQQKAYSFYTVGKPKQIIKNLYPMIKAINKQGVIFKYTTKRVKGAGGTYYKVTINKENAQMYYYTCAIGQKMFDSMNKVLKGWYEDWLYDYNTLDSADYEDIWEGVYYASYEDFLADCDGCSNAYQAIAAADCFNDLSDIVKLYMFSWSRFIGNDLLASYESASKGSPRGDLNYLRELYNQTAHYRWWDYAEAKITLASMFGFNVNKLYHRNRTVGFEGVATNSDGVKLKYSYYNRLELQDASLVPEGQSITSNDLIK